MRVESTKLRVTLAIIGLLGFPAGCKGQSDSVACTAFCERMEQCANPSGKDNTNDLSKERLQAAHLAFEKAFGDRGGCVKGCRRTHGKKHSDMMKKCLAASGCHAFFRCIDRETKAQEGTGASSPPGAPVASPGKGPASDRPKTRTGARTVGAAGNQELTASTRKHYDSPAARCKRLCEMRKRCAGAFVEKLWQEKNLPPDLREEIKKEMQHDTANVATCMTQCLGGKYRMDDTGKCLQTNDCQTFLRCFQAKKNTAQGRPRHASASTGRRTWTRPRKPPRTSHSSTLCGRFCRRMSRCTDAFALLVGRDMNERQIASMKRALRKQFGNRRRCLADCRRTKTRQEDPIVRKCLAAPGCKGFARCVLAAARVK